MKFISELLFVFQTRECLRVCVCVCGSGWHQDIGDRGRWLVSLFRISGCKRGAAGEPVASMGDFSGQPIYTE